MKTFGWVALLLFLSTAAQAAAPPYAITNARIVVSPERTIASGVILMRDGLIQAVGDNVAIPADARIYDAKGLTVYAGWIDAYTHYGLAALARSTTLTLATATPATPGLGPPGAGAAVPEDINSGDRYLWPKPSGVNAEVVAAARITIPAQPDARRSLGFTTVLSVPREGSWQGTSALVNLGSGPAPEAVVRPAAAMHASFQTGGQAGGGFGRGYPGSLMGVFAVLRQSLLNAQQYREALALYEQNGGRGLARPKFDPASAALLPALEGKVPVVFAASTAEQIHRALRFADEFKLKPILYGGAEAWKVAEVLKSRNLSVVVDLTLDPPAAGTFFGGGRGGSRDPANSPARLDTEANAGRLEKAGVRFAFASGSLERPDQIAAQVRTAVSKGLSKTGALRALTLAPAEIFGAGGQLGSIEPGKIANLTVFDGEAFEEKTRVRAVVIDGQFYYPAATPAGGAGGAGLRAGGGFGPKPPAPKEPIPERKPPQPEPPAKDVLIWNATILTVTNGTMEGGSIWIQDGKIKQLGKTVSAPADARRIDGSGRYVMPGIIDSHSHSAVSGGVNEGSLSVTAQVRIDDVLDPEDIDLYRALAGGVTTLNILHGSANAIGGQNAVVKIKWGRPVGEMLFPGAPRGIKMALGENPKRSNFGGTGTPRFPATRMGVENVIRESFTRAREYARQREDYRARSTRGEKLMPPGSNLTLETLADVLAGKILVHAHCYRADEISMLLDLADEFGFKIRSLQHVLEGYKVADKIRRHGAGASTFADMWGYKMEAYDGTAYNVALMAKAGVRSAVNSDSDERVRRLYQEAAKSIKYGGLTETQALRLITIDPAWMLGVDNRVGSIETGKDADLAIFNGHPFSPYSRVELTLIDGQVFFDRARDLEKRIPWKEEYEPEPPRRPGGPPTGPTPSEEAHP